MWLPEPGASAPLLDGEQAHVAVGLPQLMTKSRDYVLRLDPHGAYVDSAKLKELGYLAQERAGFFMIERPFERDLQLDTSYARSIAEYDYAFRLNEVVWEEMSVA